MNESLSNYSTPDTNQLLPAVLRQLSLLGYRYYFTLVPAAQDR